MSRSETSVVPTELPKQTRGERVVALGPGLVRRKDGSFLRPTEANCKVRCLGPIAHCEVSLVFQGELLKEGAEPLLLLYPLSLQSALGKVSVVDGEDELGAAPRLSIISELPDGVVEVAPTGDLLALFAEERMPVLSLNLEQYMVKLESGNSLGVKLELSRSLPTEDGKIVLRLPCRAAPELTCEGETRLQVTLEFEDGEEFVEPPKASLEFESAEADGLLLMNTELLLTDSSEDIEVYFRPGRTEMPVTRLRRNSENFIFSIFPPSSIPASPQRRDIVFVLDASENLHEGVFEGVRGDILDTLRGLDDSDRFALVTFGRDIDGFNGGEFCEVSEVEEACKWLAGIEPKGRADVHPLLERIQSLPSQPDRQLCIFLLAGGHVGNEPAILRSLDFDQSDRRYYTIGIGPSFQQAFLRRLALLTRGRFEAAPTGLCREPLDRLLGQTRALLTEVAFESSEGGEQDFESDSLVPVRMTSLTPQGPVHCLGRGSPSSLRFRSKDETGVFFAGTTHAKGTENLALGGVWAGLKVRELLDSIRLTTGSKRQALREELVTLAAAYGILIEETVLVVGEGDEQEVQLNVFPNKWLRSGGSVEPKVDDDNPVSTDYRRGLVARDGLFKGAKFPGDVESNSSEGPTRHGLRSRSSGSQETGMKPVLERGGSAKPPMPTVVGNGTAASQVSEASEADSPVLEGDHLVEEAVASGATADPSSPATAQVAPSVLVFQNPTPVVHLALDPYSGARDRLNAYQTEMLDVEVRTALAGLAGLPSKVSVGGADLSRILAQTVAHLEKRGYYSSAVAVLGLLLQDFRTPEVLKKFEALIVAWADSLDQDCLPEAVYILQMGGRICVDSTALRQKLQELWERWGQVSEEQGEMAQVRAWQPALRSETTGDVLSPLQLEFARMQQQQAELAQALTELKTQVLAQSPLDSEPLKDEFAEVQKRIDGLNIPSLEQIREISQEGLKPLTEALENATQVFQESRVAASAAYVAEPERAELPETSKTSDTAEEASETPEPSGAPEEAPEPPSLVQESEGALIDVPREEAAVEVDRPVASSPSMPEEQNQELSVEVDQTAAPRPAGQPTSEELQERLLQEPRDPDCHQAVRACLPEAKDRINFYRDLVKVDRDQPYHSLALARAYRDGDQTKVAVVHYQKYLRSEKDPDAYLELAEAYDELGKANLSSSARKAAQVYGK